MNIPLEVGRVCLDAKQQILREASLELNILMNFPGLLKLSLHEN